MLDLLHTLHLSVKSPSLSLTLSCLFPKRLILPQGHTFKWWSFRKQGTNGVVEVHLIMEAKYFRKEIVNPLVEVDPEQRGWTSKRWRRISQRMWEWAIWWLLVRTPLGTHGTHHGIWPPYSLFLKTPLVKRSLPYPIYSIEIFLDAHIQIIFCKAI